MKVAYESPISLLEESVKYNDYQYCLVHLLGIYKRYEEWFTSEFRKRVPNGEIILDNSAFELQDEATPYGMDQYAGWINRVKPNYFILHDKLNDKDATIQFSESFMKHYVVDLPPECEPIGVIQGNSWDELKECYLWMDGYVDYIAIPCHIKYFGDDPLAGRVRLIHDLEDAKIWNKRNKHHLLGVKSVAEYQHYDYKDLNIVSLDTSKPVALGIHDLPFDSTKKPKGWRMAEHINDEISQSQKDLILQNVEQFTKIAKQQYFRK